MRQGGVRVSPSILPIKEDPALVQRIAKVGCIVLLVDIETFPRKNLDAVQKAY